jgi:hypothetical protein
LQPIGNNIICTLVKYPEGKRHKSPFTIISKSSNSIQSIKRCNDDKLRKNIMRAIMNAILVKVLSKAGLITSKGKEWDYKRMKLLSHRGPKIRLKGRSLKELRLENINLQGADLESANLGGANLHRAFMPGSSLKGAILCRACFELANLINANLEHVNANTAQFYGAQLKGANFSNADLSNADFHVSFLEGANLEGANLKGANFRSAWLQHTNLKNTIIENTDFRDALYNSYTKWPDDFDPELNGLMFERPSPPPDF